VTEEAEGLYGEWLNQDPGWGWGWIAWSDCYRFRHTEFRDWARSEQLLREGLAVAEARNRTDILDRLADLCKEQGRTEEAHEFRQQSKNSTAAAETWLTNGSASAATVAANAAGELRTVERRQKEDRAERPVFVREREEI
jgi:hypothetical protein